MTAAARFSGALGAIALMVHAVPDCEISSLTIYHGTSSVHGVLEAEADAEAWHAALPLSTLDHHRTVAGSVHHTVSTEWLGIPVSLTAITHPAGVSAS
jgi:hypothetical protein